jgi:hypothetical protein
VRQRQRGLFHYSHGLSDLLGMIAGGLVMLLIALGLVALPFVLFFGWEPGESRATWYVIAILAAALVGYLVAEYRRR